MTRGATLPSFGSNKERGELERKRKRWEERRGREGEGDGKDPTLATEGSCKPLDD